jgi:hypothetical protein
MTFILISCFFLHIQGFHSNDNVLRVIPKTFTARGQKKNTERREQKEVFKIYPGVPHFFLLLSFSVVLRVHCWKLLEYIIIEFTPLQHSPLFPYPHSLNSFNKYHFSIYIHEYLIFLLHSPLHPFLTSFPLLLAPTLPPPPHTGPVLLSCSPFLKKGIFVCLFV